LKTRYKGIQTVFEALGMVRHRLPRIQFRVLAGGDTGPWREEAARWGVDDLVIFDGTLSGGEPVLRWLDGIDVYLQPSFKEGLPRALIEAMTRGCPVIASTCAGIPELVEADCLIRPGDARHLGELLVRASIDCVWREQQAERNWREAGEYAQEKLDERREDFWRRFAAYAEASARRAADLSVGR
jgi:glycosyltransferase involved in cell wall biosynthesis